MGCAPSRGQSKVAVTPLLRTDSQVSTHKDGNSEKRILQEEIEQLRRENRKLREDVAKAEPLVRSNNVAEVRSEEKTLLLNKAEPEIQFDESPHIQSENEAEIRIKRNRQNIPAETVNQLEIRSDKSTAKSASDVLIISKTEKDGLNDNNSNSVEVPIIEKLNFGDKLKSLIGPITFENADDRALKAPAHFSQGTVEELARYLTSPFPSSPLLRLRAIWRWVTSHIHYNADGYFSGEHGRNDAQSVLWSGVAVCQGYSNLMMMLAKHVDLTMELVRGYSKGLGHSNGASFEGKENNHAWNTVMLNGEWWLLDSTWSAGHVNGRVFVSDYNEHYFLTDPKAFVFDHFPEDSSWQLISPPYDLKSYESWAKFSKYFFQFKLDPVGLDLKNHIITTADGQLELQFISTSDHQIMLSGHLKSVASGEEMERYVHTFTSDRVSSVLVNVPKIGEYKLELYAGEEKEDSNGAFTLAGIVDYNITCTGTSLKSSCPLPKSYSNWKAGFRLTSPREGVLHAGETYTFHVTIPEEALDLALVAGKARWIHFPTPASGDDWKMDVEMKDVDAGEVAKLVMKTSEGGENFSTLLEYVVKMV